MLALTKSKPQLQKMISQCFTAYQPRPYTGKSYEEIRNDRKFLFPFYGHHYYKDPFYAVEGHKEYVYDEKGREYIDLIGGISCINVGHSHPRLNAIYQSQAHKLSNISSYYVNQYQGLYAEKLCTELGNDLDTVFYFNSGSQSNDFAYNLVKAYTKSNTVVSLRNAYHGTAGNSFNLTNIGMWLSNLPRGVDLQKLAWPNFYRNAHATVDSLIKDAEEQLDSNTNGKIAGFWVEPIMGAGGINPLPTSYVQRMHQLVKKYNGLFVADEVQTGFGRIGKNVWGFKQHNVKPDVVVIAKAIANGVPFSAVITRKEIADSINHDYFNSYAGGPLECRLAIEVLDIIKDEKLADNTELVGTYMLNQFKRIQKKCKYIGEVRGQGMMIGIEFVRNPETKEPAPQIMAQVLEGTRQLGILYGKGGIKGHLIRCLGPLCLSLDNAKKAIAAFETVVSKLQ